MLSGALCSYMHITILQQGYTKGSIIFWDLNTEGLKEKETERRQVLGSSKWSS